jgi:hypothetical protein
MSFFLYCLRQMSGANVVFVHLQHHSVPTYLISNIEIVHLINPNAIVHVITDSSELKTLLLQRFQTRVTIHDPQQSSKTDYFDRQNKLPTGFWTNCLRRFFVLEAFMTSTKIQNIFHLENDVICYIPLTKILNVIQQTYQPTAMISTFDHDERCVPGFNFIPNVKSLSLVNNFALNNLSEPNGNDMRILGLARINLGPLLLDAFPVCPKKTPLRNLKKEEPISNLPWMQCSRFFEAFEAVFDAAAIGQLIDGTDPGVSPHHGPGFINETCYVNYATESQIKFEQGYPFISFKSNNFKRWFPIATLHVHSKKLEMFLNYLKGKVSSQNVLTSKPFFSEANIN